MRDWFSNFWCFCIDIRLHRRSINDHRSIPIETSLDLLLLFLVQNFENKDFSILHYYGIDDRPKIEVKEIEKLIFTFTTNVFPCFRRSGRKLFNFEHETSSRYVRRIHDVDTLITRRSNQYLYVTLMVAVISSPDARLIVAQL